MALAYQHVPAQEIGVRRQILAAGQQHKISRCWPIVQHAVCRAAVALPTVERFDRRAACSHGAEHHERGAVRLHWLCDLAHVPSDGSGGLIRRVPVVHVVSDVSVFNCRLARLRGPLGLFAALVAQDAEPAAIVPVGDIQLPPVLVAGLLVAAARLAEAGLSDLDAHARSLPYSSWCSCSTAASISLSIVSTSN